MDFRYVLEKDPQELNLNCVLGVRIKDSRMTSVFLGLSDQMDGSETP